MSKVISIDRKPESLWEGYCLHEAIAFATMAHSGQRRKGSDIDYISHPMEVLQILASIGAPMEVQVAGVLHDVVEDNRGITLVLIAEEFGEEVAQLVESHTQDKTKPWKKRKEEAIEEVEKSTYSEKLITIADKVSNLRSMVSDYEDVGETLWERFNADKQSIVWYYGKMQSALSQLKDYPETKELYQEMVDLYKSLFVFYFIDEQQNILYQTDFNEYSCYSKDTLRWQSIDTIDFQQDQYTHLLQEEAEEIEAIWETMG